jgi:hypothetical protein
VALEALQHAHLIQRWVADGAEVELWQVDKSSAWTIGKPNILGAASLSIRTPKQL